MTRGMTRCPDAYDGVEPVELCLRGQPALLGRR